MKKGECPLLCTCKLELNPLRGLSYCVFATLMQRGSEAWFTDAGGAECLGAARAPMQSPSLCDLEEGGQPLWPSDILFVK